MSDRWMRATQTACKQSSPTGAIFKPFSVEENRAKFAAWEKSQKKVARGKKKIEQDATTAAATKESPATPAVQKKPGWEINALHSYLLIYTQELHSHNSTPNLPFTYLDPSRIRVKLRPRWMQSSATSLRHNLRHL